MGPLFSIRRMPERDAIAVFARLVFNRRWRECRVHRWGQA